MKRLVLDPSKTSAGIHDSQLTHPVPSCFSVLNPTERSDGEEGPGSG